MGKVTDYIVSLLSRQVDARGIVVWYDPQKAYQRLSRNLSLPDTTVVFPESGFFRLRQEIEPRMEWVEIDGTTRPGAEVPPCLIIYVPMAHDDCGYALVEAETAGCRMEPGAADVDCNTSLSRIVETMFKEIQPGRAAHLAQQAEEGRLTIEELDIIAEEAVSPATGALKIVFGQAAPTEILLLAAATDIYDDKLEEKQSLGELKGLVLRETGLDLSAAGNAADLRKMLRRSLLLCELAMALPEDQRPPKLKGYALPAKVLQQDMIKHLCNSWRNRHDLKDFYITAALVVEAEAGLVAAGISIEPIMEIETFPFIESAMLAAAQSNMLGGRIQEAEDLVARRSGLFWGVEKLEFQLHWKLLRTAVSLIKLSNSIRDLLRKNKWTLDELINAYTRYSEPWMDLDRLARHLESQTVQCEMLEIDDEDQFSKVLSACRSEYNTALAELSENYSAALQKAEFRSEKATAHTATFSSVIQPMLQHGNKVAYFLVDALRYELAAELLEGLREKFEFEISPMLGQLPGVTAVGMAALLPGAEKGLSLELDASSTKLMLNGIYIKDRAARLDWIAKNAGTVIAPFKLGEIVKAIPKWKKEVARAGLVIVTSQEFDRLGEEGVDDADARKYMEGVIEKLRRGIRVLAEAGVTHFVIAPDHGFIFAEGLEQGLQMDPPGGNTVELHTRVWIGQGGANGKGYFRVKASDLELGGPLELAFPHGLGTFKVPGGVGAYFHGGCTLQENLLPLCVLKRKAATAVVASVKLKMDLARPVITNRYFTLNLDAEAQGLFKEGQIRIILRLLSDKKDVGSAKAAIYGFELGTGEVVIKCGEPNAVTVALNPDVNIKQVTIQAIDCDTQLPLKILEDIKVDLII